MMIPPYRDPELRRAFALSPSEQRALLMQMAGEAPNETASGGAFTFQPVPPTTRRTSHALVCLPATVPPSAVMGSDSMELSIWVEHEALNRRNQPRREDAIELLASTIEQHGPLTGVHSVAFTPPRLWTVQTIRKVMGLMSQCLPKGAQDLDEHEGHVHYWPHRGFVEIMVGRKQSAPRYCDNLREWPYRAIVHLQPKATAAIDQWFGLYQQIHTHSRGGGGTFERIDALLAAAPINKSTSSQKPNRRLYDEDDRDLDFIERAARQALHGAAADDEGTDEDVWQQIAALKKRIDDLLDNR